jgi:hypothetical protein
MARYRGTLRGCRGEASRLGHTSSGLTTVAASWQGAVRVELYACGDRDFARVSLTSHRGAGIERLLFDGPVSGALQSIERCEEGR